MPMLLICLLPINLCLTLALRSLSPSISSNFPLALILVTPLTRYSRKTWPGLIVNAHQHNLLTLNFSKTSISLPTSDETVTIID